MPTLIGRFNELLHQLSSSATTDSSGSHQPPTRPGANRSHHVHRHASISSSDRNVSVKRSNSASSSRIRPTPSSSKSNRNQKSDETSAGHRSRHRQTSGSHHYTTRQSNQSSSRRDLVHRRDSTSSVSRRHHTSSTRRRHSIASVTSVTVSSHSGSTNPTPKKSYPTSVPIQAQVMSSKLSKKLALANNNNDTNAHENSSKLSVMTTSNIVDSATSDIDESLASKLARKMKISAISRKGSSCNASSLANGKAMNISKKYTKNDKKNSTQSESQNSDGHSSFIYRYLNGNLSKKHPDIISGKTCYDLPIKEISSLETQMVAACTGPSGGLLTVNTAPSKPFDLADDVDFIDEDYPDSSLSSTGEDLSPRTPKSTKSSASTVSSDTGEMLASSDDNGSPISLYGSKEMPSDKSDSQEPVAGVNNWNCAKDSAYGISTTLYESHPSTKRNAGDPIADSFGICVRENSAIIALADGVNWGDKACLASRCAVHGCIDYLNKALYSAAESTRIRNTLDIFVALLRSFNAAHHLILAQGGHLTTLCAAVICQLKNSDRFIVCTCNVGDSLAYVYSPTHGVREITQASHDIFSMRDMRDALGALGPVSGSEPELNNLTVAMTVVDIGDIVFLTSDGITDNFDPVVGKFAMPKKEQETTVPGTTETKGEKPNANKKGGEQQAILKTNKKGKSVQRSNSNPERSTSRKYILNPENYTSKGLPLVSAQQRHELTLLRMEDIIMNGVNDVSKYSPKMTAKTLCKLMVEFSTKLTMAKRHLLEDPELYSDTEETQDIESFDKQRRRRRLVGHKLAQVPGKLDHASIAAVEVDFYGLMAAKKNVSHRKNVSHQTINGKSDATHSDKEIDPRYNLKMKATLARFESQELLEFCESGPI